MELGQYKIRVNSISPGLFKSEITEGLMAKKWLNNVAMKIAPLKTFGETNPAITLLVRYHDSSQYITGNIFIVDYGLTLPGLRLSSPLYSLGNGIRRTILILNKIFSPILTTTPTTRIFLVDGSLLLLLSLIEYVWFQIITLCK